MSEVVQLTNNPHYENPINKTLRDYNEFITLVFKRSPLVKKHVIDTEMALKIAGRLKLLVNKTHLENEFLKFREN